MARAKRVIYEGAIYHVILRGNNRYHIFNNQKHKSFLIKQLKDYNEILDFELLAYVIMDNHYHFLIRTNKNSISEVMFYINNALGKYLSRELNRTGHNFDNRYTCKLVTSEIYLIWLLRYVHRNPVRAGICSNIDAYRWSSHYYYKRGISSFVKTDLILSLLGSKRDYAIRQYHTLVTFAGDDVNHQLDLEALKNKYNFNDVNLGQITKDAPTEAPLTQCTRKSLDDIFRSLNLDYELEQLLLSGSKKPSLTNYKLNFIKEALKHKYTLKEISAFLNVKSNSLSMLLSRHKVSRYEM
ncbi:transposase [Clostridium thermarum]|uniref:transposase n=1 Tax=Clostridium thermarum TaxID=1716543 RepID=UPI0011241D36|nr:transposase [Clostridium thermarum]